MERGRDSQVAEGQAAAPKPAWKNRKGFENQHVCVCACVCVYLCVPTCIGLRSTLDVVCFFFVLFCFDEIGSLYIALALLELTLWTSLILNSEVHLPLSPHC